MGRQPDTFLKRSRIFIQHLTSHLLQCDTGPAWCDPTSCQKQFSGPGSSCASPASANSSSLNSTTTTTPSPYVSSIPNIDVCGHAVGGVSCPGAGVPPGPNEPGYYYRCCSDNGHCGPKNNIQSQDLYCGASVCQPGYGDCATNRTAPPPPPGPPQTAGMGQTCGPIVNAKCADGLCCSGSNFCGTSIARPRQNYRIIRPADHEIPPKKATPQTSAERQTGASRYGASAVPDNGPYP